LPLPTKVLMAKLLFILFIFCYTRCCVSFRTVRFGFISVWVWVDSVTLRTFPISIFISKHFDLCSCGYAVYFSIEVLTQFRQWLRMFYLCYSQCVCVCVRVCVYIMCVRVDTVNVTLSVLDTNVCICIWNKGSNTHLHQPSPGAALPDCQELLAPG